MFSREKIEQFSETPTPFYYYDLNLLESTLKNISKEAGVYSFDVHYALKANSNDEILELISKYGLGADCVSGNEILKALDQLKIAKLLDGFRGKPAANQPALATELLNLAEFMAAHVDEVTEVEINPLFVLEDGVCAVDVLMQRI